jgi:hypothetical protein
LQHHADHDRQHLYKATIIIIFLYTREHSLKVNKGYCRL